VIDEPNLIARIVQDFRALGLVGEERNAIALYLVATSRIQDQPLHAIVQGESSNGKSFLIDKAASLFPPEKVVNTTGMSARALYYIQPPDRLVHALISLGERARVQDEKNADVTAALRQLQSEGRISRLVTMGNPGAGFETIHFEIAGPVASFESTTVETRKIFPEDANRCIILHPDETEEQTARITAFHAAIESGQITLGDKTEITSRHHAFQCQLKNRKVVIPFAPKLDSMIPKSSSQLRRAFPRILHTIKACTLLHQLHRETDPTGALIATELDYRVTRRVLFDSITELLGAGPSKEAQALFKKLSADIHESSFTAKEIEHRYPLSQQQANRLLNQLLAAGLLDREPGSGQRPAQWSFTGKMLEDCTALPPSEDSFPVCTPANGSVTTVTPYQLTPLVTDPPMRN
jgi:hypothetical protein